MDDSKTTELTLLWEEAVRDYASKSKRAPILNDWKHIVNTNANLEELIEAHESKFLTFRHHRGRFWHVFVDTMNQLQRLGRIAQGGIGATRFAPSSIILEAGLFLIDSGSAVANTYDSLEVLFRRTRDTTSRLEEYLDRNSNDAKLREILVQLLCSLLNVFGEAEATIRRGRGKELMQRISGKENKVQKALDQLDDTVQRDIHYVTAKTFITTQCIYDDAKSDAGRELLRESLWTEAVRSNDALHASNERTRIKQSGDWLLNEPLFGRWAERDFPVLWILGRPGTGKTFLASRVISHLSKSSDATITSYFYITESMNTQNTIESTLRALAYQVSGLCDNYKRVALRVCKEDRSLHSPESVWDSLFIGPFNNSTLTSKPLFIVVDGLDEATPDDQEMWLRLVRNLVELRRNGTQLPRIQVLLLGRPDLRDIISNTWRRTNTSPQIIDIRSSVSKVDIERFISKGVSEGVSLLARMNPGPARQLEKEITTRVSNSSDGLFIIAKLMLAGMKNMNKPGLIREALDKPPSGLTDMFRRVITRLVMAGGFEKEDLNEIIMWVACARRELLLGELDLVLKLRDPGQDGIVALEHELETRFGSLFIVSHIQADSQEEEEEEEEGDVSDSGIDDDVGDWSALCASQQSEEQRAGEHRSTGQVSEVNRPRDDYDNDTIPDNFFTARVKFSHTSVGQHFRTAPLQEGIGMDVNSAQAHLAMTCLRFLTNHIPKREERAWCEFDLFQYSADHFLDHLTEIQPDSLESQYPMQMEQLSEEIFVILNDTNRLFEWLTWVSDKYKFMCQLFDQKTYTKLQELLPRPSSKSHSDSGIEWLQKAKISSEVLLGPFAQSVAEGWLAEGFENRALAILFLDGYQSTWHNPHGKWILAPNRLPEHIIEHLPPDKIRQLASLGGMKPTGDWHLTLGYTLRRIKTQNHLRAALQEFRAASLVTEDFDIIADARLGEVTVLQKLGHYDETISAASFALNDLQRRPSHWTKRRLLELTQMTSLQLGNNSDALAASWRIWDLAPFSTQAAYNIFLISDETRHFTTTVRFLRALIFDETSSKGVVLLHDTLWDFLDVADYILSACAETGQLDLAEKSFKAVSTYATDSKNASGTALADAALAKLHLRYHQDEYWAIQIWERILKEQPRTVGASHAALALAPLYFTNAMLSTEAYLWVNKLKRLETQLESDGLPNLGGLRPLEEIFALIGRWYTERGDIDRARARILPLMKQAIRGLRDTRSVNNHDDYLELGRALLCSGDRANAEIAYALVSPLNKIEQLLRPSKLGNNPGYLATEQSDDEEDIETATAFEFSAVCDGMCKRRAREFNSFNKCEICIDVDFCDGCLERLQCNDLPLRICNPRHPFLRTYPPKGLVRKVAGGYMIHNSNTGDLALDDWLDGISREWLGR